ncbi:PLD nuclease N-terminal domain-containing protein [uncultured Varibaculum sp.]|uniref:PLD nuclease N-terminal domain-containing protein n=1 Tax=uncultured Varibaculum sp. TaxID=413896 RepID=UPI00259A9CBA|nr:PLD nuclease N-terminal domain-containing protein [uncultured Varibaculum sp.]
MNPIDKLLDLPTPALIGVCILIGVQLVAVVWSLICLLRDKRAHIAGLNRLVWLLVILFGQVIGPIVFLIMYFHEQRQLKVQREYEQKATAKHHQVDASSVVSKLYPKE